MSVDRILEWWNVNVSDMDKEYGRSAYRGYRDTVSRIACGHISLVKACAVFALCSPNSDYEGNLRSLEVIIRGYLNGAPVEGLRGLSTYRQCAIRSYRVLSGELPEHVFGYDARKTYSFYRNILDPSDPYFITIDGHMHNLWAGKVRTLDKSGFRPKLYDRIANDFKEASRRVDDILLPNQMQAALWWSWKRVHGIRFDYQIDLFEGVWA